MKGIRTAIRYAKALINFAQELDQVKEVYQDMNLVMSTLNDNKELQIVLDSPVIKSSLKRAVLIELFKDKTSATTIGLIDLLIENKRLSLLGEVAKQFTILRNYLRGKKVATVTTVVPLTKELHQQMKEKVIKMTGKKISVENKVNPNILGGFILRVGDVQYDASIANKLLLLKREFDNESYIPKL
jgi:F-type H+-transporting ATPase subunit delta